MTTNDIKHSGGYGWQWDFNASMSDRTWTVTLVYIAPPGEKYKPKYSDSCPVAGFTDIPLAGYKLTKVADLWQTECTFSNDYTSGDDDSGTDPDESTYELGEKDTGNTWEFTAGVVSRSIFVHPKFKTYFDNNDNLKRAYEAIMSGRVDLNELTPGQRLKRRDPYDRGLGNVSYDSAVQQFFEKIINKGITDYYARTCSYSITTTSDEAKADSRLSDLISAAGGGFTKTGSSNTSNGKTAEHSESYSQIVEEGVIKL